MSCEKCLSVALFAIAFSLAFFLSPANVAGNVQLPFDPNDYSFLVYVPAPGATEDAIRQAMEHIFERELDPSETRTSDQGNHVTAQDLATHDILIVGWNPEGDTAGLSAAILAEGITGRVLLSGHDLDFHTAPPQGSEEYYRQAAQTMLIQAIDWVLQGDGTGLIALGCTDSFPYLPPDWELDPCVEASELVTEFTLPGLASGVFTDLEPGDMCDWDKSYHNRFTINPNSTFVSFELGGATGDDIVTVARIGPDYMKLTKTDDVAIGDPNDPEYHTCVSAGDEITYTIAVHPGDVDEYFVTVTDTLPLDLAYVSSDPTASVTFDPDLSRMQVIWEEFLVPAYDPNDPDDPNYYYSLTVQVLPSATPLGAIENIVEVEASSAYSITTESTPVCCWGGDVIYVDPSATGFNTGTCWDDAYTDLQTALARAAEGCGTEIWVTRGTYSPGDSYDDAFHLPDNVALYGGFVGRGGGETSRSQRNFVANSTILTGNGTASYVVTADNQGDAAILDGFTLRSGVLYGLYCYNADPNLVNCIVTENGQAGIYSSYSDASILNCVVTDNAGHGIHFNYGSPTVKRCNIHDNAQHGIYAAYANPTLTNNWIHYNGDTTGCGIYLASPQQASSICNNTIVHNTDYAISRTSGTTPSITNCILWHNNDLSNPLNGCTATYSCLTNPNDPNGLLPGAVTPDANHNITADPLFAYPADFQNYHLDPDSPCINKGDNSTVAADETDIDNDDRIYDSIVDMGADEACCDNDVSHPFDLSADGIINLNDYALVAAAWLSIDPDYTIDPNLSVNWNSRCDLDANHTIELPDLALLVEPDTWLWDACWYSNDSWMMMRTTTAGDDYLAPALAGVLDARTLESARYARWLAVRPPYEPTLLQQIWQLEDLIAWAVNLWMTDETVRKELSEEDFKAVLNELYDTLADLRIQYLSESTGQPPETFQPYP